MVRCPVLAGGNECLGSQAGPSCALTVFLLAQKTFSTAWTHTAPDSTRRWRQLFSPLVSGRVWSMALRPRWRGGFSVGLHLFSQAYLQKTSQG